MAQIPKSLAMMRQINEEIFLNRSKFNCNSSDNNHINHKIYALEPRTT